MHRHLHAKRTPLSYMPPTSAYNKQAMVGNTLPLNYVDPSLQAGFHEHHELNNPTVLTHAAMPILHAATPAA
jgi:hypothetical protein